MRPAHERATYLGHLMHWYEIKGKSGTDERLLYGKCFKCKRAADDWLIPPLKLLVAPVNGPAVREECDA